MLGASVLSAQGLGVRDQGSGIPVPTHQQPGQKLSLGNALGVGD
jgi:hypothetical protein